MVRHARLRIARGDPGDELGSLGMTRHDGRAPGLAAAQGLIAVNERDAVLLPHAAVTGGAGLIQDRANIAAEVNPRGGTAVPHQVVRGDVRSSRDCRCSCDHHNLLAESHWCSLLTMMLVIASG